MKSIFKKLMALGCMTAAVFGFSSCDDELDIQQSYPFTVEIMPVPNKVTKGETVEIRCEMIKEGEFAEALYTIRYFQFEGEGTLKWTMVLPSCRTTAICWRMTSSVCTTHRSARRHRTSSWLSRIISEMPLSWSLTSMTTHRPNRKSLSR